MNVNSRISYASLMRRFCSTSSCSRTSVARHAGIQAHRHRIPQHTASSCRSFSSSRPRFAALASHPPGQKTELVYAPTSEILESLESEDPDGPDVDLIPHEEATLDLTERAAEVCKLLGGKFACIIRVQPSCGAAIKGNISTAR